MNIEEHNQRKPLKRATLQQAHHPNKTMNNQSIPQTVQQAIEQAGKEMGAQDKTTTTATPSGGLQAEQQQRGARRPREDESDSHYDNDHMRKKTSLEYHDTKTEGAYFISTTYDMINRCNNQCPEIACWSPDGKTVLIKDQVTFATKILPDYFTSKYESFTRQLSFYGFRKMQARNQGKKNKKTQKCASFINDKFQRDKPDLLKFIKRTTNHGINALKQSEEDKIYMEEQKKEVHMLKEVVEEQKKEIQFLRIVQMEMKTQLAGVMQQVEMLKKESVLYAAGLQQQSGRSRRSYNLPPPLSQKQRAGNKPVERTIQQPQVITMPTPNGRSHSSGRTCSTESKMNTLLAAVETADKEFHATTMPQTATLAPFATPAAANQFLTFQRIPSNDLRTNSFLRTLSGGPFPENWVLPTNFAGLERDKIGLLQNQFHQVETDANGLVTTMPQQQLQGQVNRPDRFTGLSTFGKDKVKKTMNSPSQLEEEK